MALDIKPMKEDILKNMKDKTKFDDNMAVSIFEFNTNTNLIYTTLDDSEQCTLATKREEMMKKFEAYETDGGGTNIEEALRTAVAFLNKHHSKFKEQRIFFLTDGEANQGQLKKGEELAQLIKNTKQHTCVDVLMFKRDNDVELAKRLKSLYKGHIQYVQK